MAAKDARQLRDDAAEAIASGKFKRAIEAYLELERVEPRDPQWPKRTAEAYRRLGRNKEAVAGYERAAERYTQGGFMVQAIAVCKLILQLDPNNSDTARRLAGMNATRAEAPTRIGSLTANHPGLLLHSPTDALARPSSLPDDAGLTLAPGGGALELELELAPATGSRAATVEPPSFPASVPPSIPQPGARRPRPSSLPAFGPGVAIVDVALGAVVEGSRFNRTDGSTPGVMLIPLEDELEDELENELEAELQAERNSELRAEARANSANLSGESQVRAIRQRRASELEELELLDAEALGAEDRDGSGEIQVEMLAMDHSEFIDPSLQIDLGEIEEPEELSLEDLEEIPLAVPKQLSNAAQRALAETPLLAGLSASALEALIDKLELVSAAQGEVLFREGDIGDALYIISEGQVAVASEGPPRVEIGRLGEGAFFGEVALVTDQPRSATVTATMPSELLKLDRDILSEIMSEHPEVLKVVLRFVRDRLVERLVLTSPMFRPFADDERRALAARFRFLEIDRGATVIPAGTKSDGLYILLAGRLGTRTAAGPEIYGPGDLLGESSLLSGQTFENPVESIGKALALCLPAAEFRELIMTHPHVLEYVGDTAEARRTINMV